METSKIIKNRNDNNKFLERYSLYEEREKILDMIAELYKRTDKLVKDEEE